MTSSIQISELGLDIKKQNSLSEKQLRWAARIPRIIGWVYVVAALWSAATFFIVKLSGFEVIGIIALVFEVFNVPVSSNLFTAAVFLLFAATCFMRKRLAMWLVIGMQVLVVLAHLVSSIWLYLGFYEPVETSFAIIHYALTATSLAIAVLTVVVLWRYRFAFPGYIYPGNIPASLVTLIAGLIIDFGIGCLLVFSRVDITALSAHEQIRHLRWIVSTIVGKTLTHIIVPGYQPKVTEPVWITAVLSVIAVIVVFISVVIFLRGRVFPARSQEQDFQLRSLLLQWGSEDSLSYYGTRNDRCLVFSSDKKACISYGIASGVAVAGGDPIGNPASWDNAVRQWIATCYTHGWIPAVEAASQKGAITYRRAGLRARLMGDEAIVYPADFDAAARYAKPLMAAYSRVSRAGVTITMQRQSELSENQLMKLRKAAVEYRVGSERGFSMALDRMFSPEDEDVLVVTATSQEGTIECLLTFVPWGRDGVSLNLMRRKPDSVNGVVEAMVVHMCLHARDIGINRMSLNFAMLRHVFVEGEAVDAGIIDRLQRRILVKASRVWQLESLYESNARYQPEWYPRYMCYAGDPLVVISMSATAMLEGFMPAPRILVPTIAPNWPVTPEYVDSIRQLKRQTLEKALTYRLNDQQRARRMKAVQLRALGRDPFPAGIDLGESTSNVIEAMRCVDGRLLRAHGRIVYRRNFGGVIFYALVKDGFFFQVIAERNVMNNADFTALKLLDLGDDVVFEGPTLYSHKGEPSIGATTWQVATKALRPVPEYGVELDANTKTRQRTTALLVDHSRVQLLKHRSVAIATARRVLGEQGYLEVETPMLQAVHGGANARPFTTYFNAYSTNVFLRIAPELYLKRLAVAGMPAIYELGRSFRNEGADATHNPEFTSLEVYKAGGDYHTMRILTEQMIRECATALYGRPVIRRPAGTPGTQGLPVVETVDGVDMCELSIEAPWKVIDVYSAVSQASGTRVTPDTSEAELRALCVSHHCDVPPGADEGALITVLYDELVEADTIMPTFYTDFPVSTSPLTRKHRKDPRLAERWDLVAFGMELGTAYTELTDPDDQRERFTAQSLAAAAGDPEAMSVDYDFLQSLELGLVPTGGLGIGIDRMVMLLTGASIRQILAFPFVKPEEQHHDQSRLKTTLSH
ncbi:MAG: bifunctional lysylphosphatidylglycerol synthetase/lysine--tRNA ligase LysX [Actinomycetaceae bacterium]|nr:bifunctional lysylphosphatidylglycerol synthetase/lysine--tRNA ligase LysX [Actinomycetaceae bacterium]